MKMTIGKLAKTCGVTVETIRFYEKKNLIGQPPKAGHFRYYSAEWVMRIRFIQNAKKIGFTLKEIKELLDLKSTKTSQCKDILAKTELKVAQINQQIALLKQMKKTLTEFAGQCEKPHDLLKDCSILDCFTQR